MRSGCGRPSSIAFGTTRAACARCSRLSLVYLHLGPFSRYAVNVLDQRMACDAGPPQRSAMARQPLPALPV